MFQEVTPRTKHFYVICHRNVLGCLLSSWQPSYLPTSYIVTTDSHVGLTAKLLKAQRAYSHLGILKTWRFSTSEIVSEITFLMMCGNDTSNGVGVADLGTTL